MHKDLERRLVERWAQWFNTGGDILSTAVPGGFEHGDGWFNIVWRLCEDIEPLVKKLEQEIGCQFEVRQVKEKLGGRFYVNHANDDICRRIETAIQESLRTCEVCGKAGSLREGDWLRTLCDEHDVAQKTGSDQAISRRKLHKRLSMDSTR
jgi:hypothetical protein